MSDIDFNTIADQLMAKYPLDRAEPRRAVDPAAARRRWLGDRAVVLLEGRFTARAVEAVQADQLADVPALTHSRAFLAPQTTKRILVLLGGRGAGKTTAATWLAAEVGGSRPGFVRAGELERAGRYDRDFNAWVASRTLLVIDDMGVEWSDARGAFRSILDELVDVAYGARRRLVLSTNLDAGTLADRLGERIWSRFCDADGAELADCGNVDLRVHPPGGAR